jgi:hypothetical protein
MPSMLAPVWAVQLVTAATATTSANGSSGVLNLPQAESYLFILDVTTLTGTGTTLDISLAISPVSTVNTAATTGSVWHQVCKFTQVTTATGTWALRMQPAIGRGEAASAYASGGSATANWSGSTSIANNVPLTPQIRFYWATSAQTTYTFNIYAYGYAKADASY